MSQVGAVSRPRVVIRHGITFLAPESDLFTTEAEPVKHLRATSEMHTDDLGAEIARLALRTLSVAQDNDMVLIVITGLRKREDTLEAVVEDALHPHLRRAVGAARVDRMLSVIGPWHTLSLQYDLRKTDVQENVGLPDEQRAAHLVLLSDRTPAEFGGVLGKEELDDALALADLARAALSSSGDTPEHHFKDSLVVARPSARFELLNAVSASNEFKDASGRYETIATDRAKFESAAEAAAEDMQRLEAAMPPWSPETGSIRALATLRDELDRRRRTREVTRAWLSGQLEVISVAFNRLAARTTNSFGLLALLVSVVALIVSVIAAK